MVSIVERGKTFSLRAEFELELFVELFVEVFVEGLVELLVEVFVEVFVDVFAELFVLFLTITGGVTLSVGVVSFILIYEVFGGGTTFPEFGVLSS